MRTKARTDANQSTIVADLRAIGATVVLLHAVGQGCPDLLVGYGGKNYLLEVKDGEKSPSRRKLTPDQEDFHRDWRGQVSTVKNSAEAMDAIDARIIPVLGTINEGE